MFSRLVTSLLLSLSAMFCMADVNSLATDIQRVMQLRADKNDNEALSVLNSIETECLNCNNDTVEVFFRQLKGEILLGNGDYSNALKYYIEVPELWESVNIKDRRYLDAFWGIAVAYHKLGQYDKAEQYYRKGLLKTVFVQEGEIFQPTFFLNLGNLYQEKGDSILAKACFEKLDANNVSVIPDGGNNSLIDQITQAMELRKAGKFEESLVLYDTILSRIKDMVGSQNEDYASVLYSKGIVLSTNLSRFAEAAPIFKEVIALGDNLEECSESVLGSMAHYLQCIAYLGNIEELNNLMHEYAERYEKCGNPHYSAAFLLRMIGNGAFWAGDYELATPIYERYLKIESEPEGTSYLEVPNMLAVCYIRQDKPQDAYGLLTAIMSYYKDDLEANQYIKSLVLHNLGRAQMLLGNYADAVTSLTQSANIYQEITGEQSEKTIQYLEECKRNL